MVASDPGCLHSAWEWGQYSGIEQPVRCLYRKPVLAGYTYTSYNKFDWLIELRWAIVGLTEQLLHEKIDRYDTKILFLIVIYYPSSQDEHAWSYVLHAECCYPCHAAWRMRVKTCLTVCFMYSGSRLHAFHILILGSGMSLTCIACSRKFLDLTEGEGLCVCVRARACVCVCVHVCV